jgi:hypothetical protein
MKNKQYVSEFEQFMNGYLEQHPEVERDKQLGWRIWWERAPVRPEEMARERESHLPRAAYYYN